MRFSPCWHRVFETATGTWDDIAWNLKNRHGILDPVVRNLVRAKLFRAFFQKHKFPRPFEVKLMAEKHANSAVSFSEVMTLAADYMHLKQHSYATDFPAYTPFKPFGTVPWEACVEARRKTNKRSCSEARFASRSQASKRSFSRSPGRATQHKGDDDGTGHLLQADAVSGTFSVS